jgi:hypothetical protein
MLDKAVREATSCDKLDWLDFGFDASRPGRDAEWKGLDFLKEDGELQKAWQEYWPQGAGIHNWDAVARASLEENSEWILVEAKANIEELNSECKAQNKESLRKITAAFEATKKALGVPAGTNWMKPYYQYCNRIAALHFLASRGIAARLLFVYFCGDKGDARRTCPGSPGEWGGALERQNLQVALPSDHYLTGTINNLFLQVTP